MLKRCGFNALECGEMGCLNNDFSVKMPFWQWKDMIWARFWSPFSNFSDPEIEEGICELEERRVDSEARGATIEFTTSLSS